MSIEVASVSKSFGTYLALRKVSLVVPTGKLVALLGPSGSGKTSLLRIIAGLDDPDPGSGEIKFHGEDVAERGIGERQVGFVFQHYALFRHMSVFENVAFGLRVRPKPQRPSDIEIKRRVDELLELVQLRGLSHRNPGQLSGGQRQRVALARALAVEPRILLLDEPFGALDAKVRKELRLWLRRLHERIHVTTVFVTHDQDEALDVADTVVIMNEGRVEQAGSPDEVFHKPASEFVMDFLGQTNRLPGQVDGGRVRFAKIEVEAPPDVGDAPAVQVFVRPHEIDVERGEAGPDSFPAKIVRVHSAGPLARLDLITSDGQELSAHMPLERYEALGLGRDEQVIVRPRAVRVFAPADREPPPVEARSSEPFTDGAGI